MGQRLAEGPERGRHFLDCLNCLSFSNCLKQLHCVINVFRNSINENLMFFSVSRIAYDPPAWKTLKNISFSNIFRFAHGPPAFQTLKNLRFSLIEFQKTLKTQ